MHRWRYRSGLLVLVTLGSACSKTEENVPPDEGYGCVGVVLGKDFSCTELDSTTTSDERTRFSEACRSEALKNLRGRFVRHCSTDAVVADCALGSEKATIRYYKTEMSPASRKGAVLGCQGRGGTFADRP